MTLKGGTSQACAACKYQRRRCTSECLLAPFFPADKTKMFQNAHKLFGVKNIVKILKDLDSNQQKQAMWSIICQSNIRDANPVYGCCGVISQLRYQIWQLEEELLAVNEQLEICRQQNQHQLMSITDDEVPSQLELGMGQSTNALPLFNHAPQPYNALPAAVAQPHSYSNSSNVGYSSAFLDTKDNVGNSLWVQHPYNSTNISNNNYISEAIQSQLSLSQPLGIQEEVVPDYDEMHTFFDTIDDRQSYIDSKEGYESSSEESMKDTNQSIEHVAENELKSAAACFSLTSVN